MRTVYVRGLWCIGTWHRVLPMRTSIAIAELDRLDLDSRELDGAARSYFRSLSDVGMPPAERRQCRQRLVAALDDAHERIAATSVDLDVTA